MPNVAGRWVPDGHEAAENADHYNGGGVPAADVDDTPDKKPAKRATRKRAGKKAETAMLDQPTAAD